MASMADLERRIRVLEDIEAIRNLKIRYLRAIDARDLDTALDCVTETVVAQFGHFGKYEGKEGITRFLKNLWTVRVVSMHQTHDTVIEITGDTTARGKQQLLVMNSDKIGDGKEQAYWAGTQHEDEYVKKDGKWKIERNIINVVFYTKYEKGWGEERISKR